MRIAAITRMSEVANNEERPVSNHGAFLFVREAPLGIELTNSRFAATFGMRRRGDMCGTIWRELRVAAVTSVASRLVAVPLTRCDPDPMPRRNGA